MTLMKSNSQKATPLRVAFPSSSSALAFEPTDIHLDVEYIFLENIYSPLVEFDAHGAIEPGVAEKVEENGNQVRFTIRSSLKTQSGVPITAVDVAFSLKRLLVLSGNTHGNFRDLICPDTVMKTVEDVCPGIEVSGNIVTLTVAGDRRPFLLPMLAAIDFAIIPKSSVDPKTLKIINMKEASGPYFVDSDDGHGNVRLKLNPNHYHAQANVPTQIDFVPMTAEHKGDTLKALLDGKVDHLTTVDSARSDEVLQFVGQHQGYSSHKTHNIRTIFLAFTERGLRELSDDERRLVGVHIRKAFHAIYDGVPGMAAREEFFPGLGDGSLDEQERAQVARINQKLASSIPKGLRIGVLKRSDIGTWLNPLSRELPGVDFYQEKDVPEFKKYPKLEDMPHAYVAATDTGFMEDISLISYSLNAGLLGLKKEDRQKWLADYMATEAKTDRMKKLKLLHYNALVKPVIVPLMAQPYTAIVRSPWKMELSELYANNQLWRIKHQ